MEIWESIKGDLMNLLAPLIALLKGIGIILAKLFAFVSSFLNDMINNTPSS